LGPTLAVAELPDAMAERGSSIVPGLRHPQMVVWRADGANTLVVTIERAQAGQAPLDGRGGQVAWRTFWRPNWRTCSQQVINRGDPSYSVSGWPTVEEWHEGKDRVSGESSRKQLFVGPRIGDRREPSIRGESQATPRGIVEPAGASA
jgi:hypothetical protein